MRFLTIAERELRVGARQKRTHRIRWITAVVFFVVLSWLLWVFDSFRAPQVFRMYSTVIFFYCLIIGTVRTADCLSSEKREGTLGLLFLTNLNGPEIIGGKLCSSALAAAYGLLAIFPLLALEMLLGGVTLGQFWGTILALANAIFFSIAAGLLASSLFVRQFTAVSFATGLALFASLGVMGLASVANAFASTRTWAGAVAIFSPLYSLTSVQAGPRAGSISYGWSILAVMGISLLFLVLTTRRLSWSWRDRTIGPATWTRLSIIQFWKERGKKGRVALRRRLLGLNPIFWLGGRDAVSAPVFMLVTVILVAVTSFIAAPFFARVLPGGVSNPMAGHLFAWCWAALGLHALVLYYAAMTSSQSLAEDKETGALELVLSTPTSERLIFRGLWMAYARKMFFPVLLAIAVHFFLIWQVATMAILDPPSIQMAPGMTPGKLIWHVLLERPIAGYRIAWGLTLALRILLLVLVMFFFAWVTLGWVGRWLGLRMKHPGFVPMVSLALLFVPSIGLFSFACYCAVKLQLYRIPQRLLIPAMVWVGFGIWTAQCVILSLWTGSRLRRNFRTVVTGRFQPEPRRLRWRPTRRGLFRVGCYAVASGTALLLIVLCFYGYQNWRSRRTWAVFQKELRQRQESLDLAPLLPPLVSDSQNFALSPAFLSWINPSETNSSTKQLTHDLKRFQIIDALGMYPTESIEWTEQLTAPLDNYARWIAPEVKLDKNATQNEIANAVLQGLKPHEGTMGAVAVASRLSCFQTSTNRNAMAVLHSASKEYNGLVGGHMLFQIRACAWLAANRHAEASADLVTSLQLARLARQIPDTGAGLRAQKLLTRSLQPLWEGIVEHRWSESELATFQNELRQFNLLGDYTNAVRRVVLAHIELWRALGTRKNGNALPQSVQIDQRNPFWRMQPQAWWLDNCIQLYEAGEAAMKNVDIANEHVLLSPTWSDLDRLPIDNQATYLLQQPYWVAFAQTALNQAIIACALERFRLAEGKYPETLDPLLPNYLSSIPKDVARGLPMLYENTGTGGFILRGVGPNGANDRNKPVSDDWLWSFPTNAPPAMLR